MSFEKTLRFETPTKRLEVEVKLERHETSRDHLDTDLKPVDGAFNRLSITMGQWERRGPRAHWREVSFGQDRETVLAFARTRKDDTRVLLERLCEIWAEWHLNDMKAGTDLQTAAIGNIEHAGNWYDMACIALAEKGLLVDRGYKFGSKWLVKRLPQVVQAEVIAICDKLA